MMKTEEKLKIISDAFKGMSFNGIELSLDGRWIELHFKDPNEPKHLQHKYFCLSMDLSVSMRQVWINPELLKEQEEESEE